MGWTVFLLVTLAMSTAFAVGMLVWLRRPVMRPTAPAAVDEPERTSYLAYEMLGFSRPPTTEPTQYIPVEQLPVMVEYRRREAARVAAILASPEEATAYISFEDVAKTLDAASSMPPPPVGLDSQELAPLFDLAVAAFGEWQADMSSSTAGLSAIAAGSERRWLDHMAMLAGASEVGIHEVFESALLDGRADLARRSVACLVLLDRHPVAALHRIESLIASGDSTAAVDALRCWSSHEADALLIERARRVGVGVGARFWLEILLERGLDPGSDLIDELLNFDDVEQLSIGLALVCVSDDAPRHRAKIQGHYFATDVRVRIAAARAGVFLHDRTAWLHCRQMATDVGAPGATELVAMLANTAEQDALLDWGERAAIKGPQVWALGLTGRRRAAELASRQLLRAQGDHQAIAALRHVIGDGDDPQMSLLTRWSERRPMMSSERRHLMGENHDVAGWRICMNRHGIEHRRALACELLVRSGGRCRLRVHGLAADLARQSSVLETLDLDTGIGFPWR